MYMTKPAAAYWACRRFLWRRYLPMVLLPASLRRKHAPLL
ncbi:hypothetical protein EVA_19550 [gut metagenome]|uniref:Uncharacterized protein n=1 Tax=gut metagenome TaxID=749906 RepID=J9FD47_9ZZZZ